MNQPENQPHGNKLQGKRALVTGASAGIGAATARALTAAGATVVLAARREDRLKDLASELGSASVLALDVRDAKSVERILTAEEFDIVVASAGLARGTGPIHKADPDDLGEMIDTNIKGVLHVARFTLPAMLARGKGDFVTLGSVAGREVYPGGSVYCATKYAVRAIYMGLRRDSVGSGVRFTTVDPGMVETEFSLARFGGDEEKVKAVYAGMTPLTAVDIADAILFAVTRPAHVNIGEIVLWPTDQASTVSVHRQ